MIYFNSNPTLSKAGLNTAPRGYEWGNFWWARASYVQTLAMPLICIHNRFVYEEWLGFVCQNQAGSFNQSISFSGGQAAMCSSGAYSFAGSNDSLSLCPPNLPMGKSFTYESKVELIPCMDYNLSQYLESDSLAL